MNHTKVIYLILTLMAALLIFNQFQVQHSLSKLQSDINIIASDQNDRSDFQTMEEPDPASLSPDITQEHTFSSTKAKSLYNEQRLANTIIKAIEKKFSHSLTSQPKSQPAHLPLSQQQKQQRQESVNAILANGYINHKDAEQLHALMQHMDEPLLKKTLSSIFTAVNRGEIQLEPGVIL